MKPDKKRSEIKIFYRSRGIERGREEGRIEGIRAIIHLAELVV